MAVHNGAAFLQQTLDSVAAQDCREIEFIIVDDASTDATPSILARAAAADRHIFLVQNVDNLGLTRSLNIGLGRARGKYIARIDADDICRPGRLSRQLQFLETHRDYVGIGCGYRVIDGRGRAVRTVKGGLDDWQVRWLSGFNPCAPHSAFFFRRIAADGTAFYYDEAFQTAQDFELWSRISKHGPTAVLPEVLIDYRRHAGVITVRRRQEQAANALTIGTRNLARRLPAEIVTGLQPVLKLFAYQAKADARTISAAVSGCDAMLAYDLPRAPTAMHQRWIRYVTAGLLADAILSRASALKGLAGTAAFAFHARAHLPALAMAVAADPMMAIKSLRQIGRYGLQHG